MAALNFDTSRFYQYGPREEMFASKVKTIQGKPLCDFLKEMDEAEYQTLVNENIEIISLQKGGLFEILTIGTLGACLGVITVLAGPVGVLGVLSGACAGGYIGHHYGNKFDAKSKIISDRVNRLFQKQLAIQTRLRTLTEAHQQDEVEQLKLVEQYFQIHQRKWEANLCSVHGTLIIHRK
jgi:hypothetical protein